jgi:hypothetical protein
VTDEDVIENLETVIEAVGANWDREQLSPGPRTRFGTENREHAQARACMLLLKQMGIHW